MIDHLLQLLKVSAMLETFNQSLSTSIFNFVPTETGYVNNITICIPKFKYWRDKYYSFKVTGDSLHLEIFASNKLFVSLQGKQL